MARGGTRREPSSLEHACPSARKTSLFFWPLSPLFSSPSSPIRPHPRRVAPPRQGAASTPKPCMGDPARLWAMRVAPRHGRPWQARLGEGGRGQPTTTTDDHEPHVHHSLNKGSTTHVNLRILRLYATIHCLPRCSKDSSSADPWACGCARASARPKGAPPEPWIRGERLWTWVRLAPRAGGRAPLTY